MPLKRKQKARKGFMEKNTLHILLGIHDNIFLEDTGKA